jgi:glucose-6-phosphate-specific signal transduction histidine kinase
MLFYPIEYKGFRVPGLKAIGPYLPRKLKLVPLGLAEGKFGWQGIIPSRAAKMGSIAIDKGLARLGKLSDFYTELEPEMIAEHLLQTALPELHEIVERIMLREQPQLWRVVPARVREAVHARVQEQLPTIVRELTDEIGQNIDQMADIKLMVIRKMEARRSCSTSRPTSTNTSPGIRRICA